MLLTVYIDARWTARNLAEVLDELEAIAGFIETGQVVNMGLQPPNVIAGVVHPDAPLPSFLELKRFQYASPGSFDLLGAAKVVEQIRLLLEFLINLWAQRNDRALSTQRLELALLQQKVELLGQLKAQHPEMTEIVNRATTDAIVLAITSGRIVSVTKT
jgi:hypothetical protein